MLCFHPAAHRFRLKNISENQPWSFDPLISLNLLYTCLTPRSLLLPLHRTIVYLSIVYTVGQVIMAISAIHDITDANKDGTPDNMTLHM